MAGTGSKAITGQHALYQTDLAERMKSSPSRIAKIEAADPSVSDRLISRWRSQVPPSS